MTGGMVNVFRCGPRRDGGVWERPRPALVNLPRRKPRGLGARYGERGMTGGAAGDCCVCFVADLIAVALWRAAKPMNGVFQEGADQFPGIAAKPSRVISSRATTRHEFCGRN